MRQSAATRLKLQNFDVQDEGGLVRVGKVSCPWEKVANSGITEISIKGKA